MKTVELPAAVRRVMDDEARAGYPLEICGALVGRDGPTGLRVNRAVAFPNTAEEATRRRRFFVDPRTVLLLDRELRGGPDRMLGFYHTHPDAEAEPSATDLEFFQLWPETVWIITAVRGGAPDTPRAWWLNDPEGPAEEIEVRNAQ